MSLSKLIKQVISDYPNAVNDCLEGNDLALGFLVGKVLHQYKNKTVPASIVINKINKLLNLSQV